MQNSRDEGGHSLGVACGHIKASPFPDQRPIICSESLHGQHALRMLGKTLNRVDKDTELASQG